MSESIRVTDAKGGTRIFRADDLLRIQADLAAERARADALDAELKALREQKPIGVIKRGTRIWNGMGWSARLNIDSTVGTDLLGGKQDFPVFAAPVPTSQDDARDALMQYMYEFADSITKSQYIKHHHPKRWNTARNIVARYTSILAAKEK